MCAITVDERGYPVALACACAGNLIDVGGVGTLRTMSATVGTLRGLGEPRRGGRDPHI